MALVVKDRVKVTTATTGTGTLTLGSAVAKFQDFSVVGDGNTTYYAIESGNGSDWEVGVGTYTASGTTLSRDTILESSNGGTAISLSGTSTVFCTYPAERSVNTEDIGVTVQAYDADTTKNDVANTFTANQTINADLTVDTNTLYVDSANNNVGIGTSSPTYKLDVRGSSIFGTGAGQATVRINGGNSGTAGGSAVYFGGAGSYVNAVGYSSAILGGTYSAELLLYSGVGNLALGSVADIIFSNNGRTAERMRITSAGNVGIGTSSPSQELEVVGEVLANNFRLPDAGGTISGSRTVTGAAFQLFDTAQIIRAYTAGTQRMVITSAGNVSIGTTGTVNNALLNVAGGINTTSGIVGWTVGDAFTLNGKTQPHYGCQFANTGSTPSGISGYFGLAFATVGLERMRINSLGSVGIGTTSPNYKLSVNSSTGINSYDGVAGKGRFVLGDPADASGYVGMYRSVAGTIGTAGNDLTLAAYTNIAFTTGAGNFASQTERMRITSTGNVGINTSGPVGLLHIKNTNDGTSVTSGVASLIFNHQGGTYTTGNYYNSIAFARPNSNGGTVGAFISPVIASSSSVHLAFGTDAGAGVLERMRIGANGDLSFNSGYGSVATAYGCRAWVNFNGDANPITIRASGNVSSISDSGTGKYTVNFTTAMPDTNYTVAGMAGDSVHAGNILSLGLNTWNVSQSTSATRIAGLNDAGTLQDKAYANVVVFR